MKNKIMLDLKFYDDSDQDKTPPKLLRSEIIEINPKDLDLTFEAFKLKYVTYDDNTRTIKFFGYALPDKMDYTYLVKYNNQLLLEDKQTLRTLMSKCPLQSNFIIEDNKRNEYDSCFEFSVFCVNRQKDLGVGSSSSSSSSRDNIYQPYNNFHNQPYVKLLKFLSDCIIIGSTGSAILFCINTKLIKFSSLSISSKNIAFGGLAGFAWGAINIMYDRDIYQKHSFNCFNNNTLTDQIVDKFIGLFNSDYKYIENHVKGGNTSK